MIQKTLALIVALTLSVQVQCAGAYKTVLQLGQYGEEVLWDSLTEQGYIRPNTAYFKDMSRYHIDCFDENTTAEEFATVIRYMYLTGTMELTLPVKDGAEIPKTDEEAADRAMEGVEMATVYLPAYDSLYKVHLVTLNYVGEDVLAQMFIELNPEDRFEKDFNGKTAFTDDEVRDQREEMEAFCIESLRLLNNNGYLTPDMTNREKAAVIFDWVGYFLIYDLDYTSHGAGVAAQTRRGVCESYAALYAQICTLAGVPTYGRTGENIANGTGHIWTVQLDEEGNLFYTDPTRGDNHGWKDIDKEFFDVTDIDPVFGLFTQRYGSEAWMNYDFFWQSQPDPDYAPYLDVLFPELPDGD